MNAPSSLALSGSSKNIRSYTENGKGKCVCVCVCVCIVMFDSL